MNTKLKTLLLATAAVGAWAASTSSHAVPAFARQVGMACTSCHFQKYPALNAFGRSFKANGYTLMGAQAKIEGEHFSLPAQLNASIYTKIRYQKTNGTEVVGTRTTNSGELQFPDEFALLLGGRVTENIGFLIEGQLGANIQSNPAASPGGVLAGFKIPMMFDMGGVKAGVIPFTTDGLGASYGFELLSTGAVRNIRVNEHGGDISAQQYIGTGAAASGFALVIADPSWYVNLTKYSPTHAATANGLEGVSPTANYLRAAYMPNWGGWDMGMGFQSWTGTASDGVPLTPGKDYKAVAFDLQAQGEVAGMPLGVYFTHGKAKGTPVGAIIANGFNGLPNDVKATTITAELGVSHNPHVTLLAAYRKGDNGQAAGAFNGTAVAGLPQMNGDNAFTFGLNYKIAQNVGLHLTHSKYSGSAYNTVSAADCATIAAALPAVAAPARCDGGTGNALTTFMLSAGF